MKKYLLPAIITILFAIVYGYCFDSKLDINGDNATYIKLAENMSAGLGYSIEDVNGIHPASHFPPGYSAILSVFVSLGINDLIFFKVLNGLFLLASLLILYVVVGKLTENRALGFASVALAVFSPKLINFSFMAMSEMSYMFLTIVVIWALYHYSQKSNFLRSPYFYIAIVAVAASYYIRTVGASLLFGMLVFYAFRREWRELLVSGAGFVLLILPWSIRNSMLGIDSRYFGTIMTVNPWRPEEGSISSVGEMISKMIANFDETVIKSFRSLLFPFIDVNFREPSSMLMILLGLAILCVVLYGAWRMGKLRFYFLAYIVANIGLFLLWHGGNGNRYVVPLTPVLFACFWVGFYRLVTEISKTKYSPYLLMAMIFPMLSPIKELAEVSREEYPNSFINYFKSVSVLSEKIPARSVVCCRKPELAGFYGKKLFTINYAYSLDTREVIKNLIDNKVDYVILDNLGFSSTERYLYPAIEAHQDCFLVALSLKNPDTYVFKFDREKAIEKINRQ